MDFKNSEHASILANKNVQIIANQLENVKKLFFSDPPPIPVILKHCMNLQTLYVSKGSSHKKNDEWTHIIIPNVTNFFFS